MPGILTNIGPIANATTLAGNAGGIVPLPGAGVLTGVAVYPATTAVGPVFVSVALFNFTAAGLGTSGHVLIPGAWVRNTAIAGGQDAAVWNGSIGLKDPSGNHLEVTVRNDSGSALSMTVAATVTP